MFLLYLVACIGYTTWPASSDEKDQIPRANMFVYWLHGPLLFASIMLSGFCTFTTAAMDKNDWPDAGPKNAWSVTFLVQIILVPLFYVLLPSLLENFGVAVRYNILDIPLVFLGIVVSVLIESSIRKKRGLAKVLEAGSKARTRRRSWVERSIAAPATKKNIAATKKGIVATVTVLIMLSFATLYPTLIIPMYRSTTDEWRLCFVCIVHPILQETLLTLMRHGRTKNKQMGELVPGAAKRSTFELQLT